MIQGVQHHFVLLQHRYKFAFICREYRNFFIRSFQFYSVFYNLAVIRPLRGLKFPFPMLNVAQRPLTNRFFYTAQEFPVYNFSLAHYSLLTKLGFNLIRTSKFTELDKNNRMEVRETIMFCIRSILQLLHLSKIEFRGRSAKKNHEVAKYFT